MKRVATDKHEAIVAIPEVVGPAVVAVEPRAIVIAFNVEQVKIGVRVGNA